MDPAIFLALCQERQRQVEMWGKPQWKSDLQWHSVLVEEVGEVARALNEGLEPNLEEELIQVATVAIAWLEERRLQK